MKSLLKIDKAICKHINKNFMKQATKDKSVQDFDLFRKDAMKNRKSRKLN